MKNQLTSGGSRSTSGQFLSHPVEKINFRFRFKHFSIFRPKFHQLFAKIMRWSFRNLEKQLTSGKKQLKSGQKTADFRFRSKHLLRFTSIPEIGHPVEIYKNYSHLPGFTSTLQPKSASPGGAGVTSGKNQLISGQKSADFRFRPRISIDHYIAFVLAFFGTSGKKQLTSGQKSADFRFRSNHLLRFTSIPEIGHPVEIHKNYSHLPGLTSTLQPKYASARWRHRHFR